jgi:hypothetical protein
LQRKRHYDDEIQHFDCLHPQNAPRWTFVEQEDFSEYERASRADKDIYERDDEAPEEERERISDDIPAMDD